MNNTVKPIIMDCDPGHDDAIAMIMALASDKVNVIGVTTAAGNQTIEKTTSNALSILTFLGRCDIPVAMGMKRPLSRELEIAPNVHGKSGLDGPSLPEPGFQPVPQKAFELTRDLILQSPEPVTIVATGPLTNTALLLLTYPEVKNNIERISLMGGGIHNGNWTSAAEFNILVDPEAAHIVFTSGVPILMSGLDVTEKAIVHMDEVEALRAEGGKVSVLVAELLDFFLKFHLELGFDGAPLHDPCAIATLIAPELFTFEDYFIQIETEGKYTTGMTLADRRVNNKKPTPNATVAMGVNRKGLIDLLSTLCKKY